VTKKKKAAGVHRRKGEGSRERGHRLRLTSQLLISGPGGLYILHRWATRGGRTKNTMVLTKE